MWRKRLIDEHIRPDFRRAVIFGLGALVALIFGTQTGTLTIRYGCALLVALFGVLATRSAAREVHRIAVARAGNEAGTPLRLLVQLAGYVLVISTVCDMLGVGLEHLLVGGAVTGIIVGLAAQPVLGNLFAGLVLLFARPYVPGRRIRVMSGALNGPHVGVIVSAGLLYTVLDTDDGPLNIPNSQLMASAVGPFDGEWPPPETSPSAPSPHQAGEDLAVVVAGAASTRRSQDQDGV
ncbi:small-conductance mechanosensitive channel [Actinoplanes lutulentus]|uniref:Mechanosensitive ion channel-like protein n=1 Tax=Actinoplanes lutulentus TaxID=1287878 RepID=A0A327Z5D7_9ACTN|nr:mechanosensitive ion channel family protein [Actinoplanes lutulentus]MBB2940354.1 small-conductance mechanosensitive channel [Actinoplanes lutulentus]RAK28847.1 mechanosensitive ion channel-like protein [Actinoplanes lutulentus]